MRKALSILAVSLLSNSLASCGEGSVCKPGTLILPSAVTLTRTAGDFISIPGRLVTGPDFGGLAIMGYDKDFENSLPGKGLAFVETVAGDFTDCDVPPTPGGTSSPPPACFNGRFLPAEHDYTVWLPLQDVTPALNSSGTDLTANFYAICNTAVLVDQTTVTIRLRDVRGSFTASVPASVNLADTDGATADVLVTVTPDADWKEPVLSCWSKGSLPAGVEPVESPWCDKNNGDPLSTMDEIADVPNLDNEATVRLKVTDAALLAPGSYLVTVKNRSLAEAGNAVDSGSGPLVTAIPATYNLSLTLQVP